MQRADSYRFFGVTVTPVAPDAFSVESVLTGRRVILGGPEVQLLMSCRTSRTLILHAQHAVWNAKSEAWRAQRGLRGIVSRFLARGVFKCPESLPVQDPDVQRIYRRLEEWSANGFLVSDSHLEDGLASLTVPTVARTHAPAEVAIDVLAIPTAGRTAALERCLQSFIENFVQHDRNPDIIVMDDSRDEASQVENDRLLRRVKSTYPGRLYSMNRQQRTQFARQVAIRAGVRDAIADFALMGHSDCDRSEGGCWNAILLLTCGKLTLQTDDDTICQLAFAPVLGDGLALTSAGIADSYWFFDSFEDAVQAVHFVDQDVLDAHERVLGRAPADLIAEELAGGGKLIIEEMDASFINKARLPESRVRMSLLGPVGDTCLYTDLYRLFVSGDSFKRLVQPFEHYHDRLSTRDVVRCVTRRTLSETIRCVGMNFAIDNRELVPPFMPVQRRGDGIFGDLMTVCFPGAFAGHMPTVLVHRPPERRWRTADDVFALQARVRVNDIVSALIFELDDWPQGQRAEDRLATVGTYMVNLANLAPDGFEAKVRRVLAARCFEESGMAIRRVNGGDGPLYWRNDVARFVKALTSSVVESDLRVPVDLTRIERGGKATSRDLVRSFGELLLHWPAIYTAAQDISVDDIAQYLTNYSDSGR